MNSPLVVYTLFACAIGHFHAAPQDPGGDASLEDTCPDPPTLERLRLVTNVNENGTGFKVGTKLKYRCASGYASSSRPSPWDVECVKDYDGRLRWRDIQTDCRPISCGHPGHLWNGKLLDAVFSFSSKVRYECDPGYNLVGQAEIYCQSDGTWTDPAPECHVVECGRPEEIPNGHVEFSSVEYGAVATYSCTKGFNLEPKNAQRTCGRDGVWTGGYIFCREITCDPPKAPRGGGLSSIAEDAGKQRMGTVVTYSCPEGKRLVGSKTSTCLPIRIWSFDAPTCANKCYVPASENGKVLIANLWSTKEVLIGTEVLPEGGKLLLQCDYGYEIQGKSRIEISCTDGFWEPQKLNCTAAPCRDIQAIPFGYPSSRTVKSGYTVEYHCELDYELEEYGGKRYCQNGQLHGPVPRCKPTFCYSSNILKDAIHMEATKSVYKAGEYLEYSCLTGFITTGSRMKCDDGTWRGNNKIFCTPAPCGNISGIENGFPTVTTVESGAMVKYQCNEGYELVATSQEGLRCKYGSFVGQAPVCKLKKPRLTEDCLFPHGRPHLKAYAGNQPYVSGAVVPHGTALHFYCEQLGEFQLRGHNSSQCIGGTWRPELPHCYGPGYSDLVLSISYPPDLAVSADGYLSVSPNAEVELSCTCTAYKPSIQSIPAILNWKVKEDDRNTVSSVSFSVKEGYNGVIRCWNGNVLKEIKLRGRRESLDESGKPCVFPTRQPRFKAYAGNKRYLPGNTIPHGTVLRFHCDLFAQAKFVGHHTSQCKNGEWSNQIPSCYDLGNDDVVVRLPSYAENHVSPDEYLNVNPRTLLELQCESNCYKPNIATHPEIILQPKERSSKFNWSTCRTHLLLVHLYVPEGYDGTMTCWNGKSSKVIKLRGRRPFECSPPSSEGTVIRKNTKEIYKVECRPPLVLTGTARLECYANGEFDRPAPYCALPTTEELIQSPNIAAQFVSDGNFSRTFNGQKQTSGPNGDIPEGTPSGSANPAGRQPHFLLGSEPQKVDLPNTALAQNESSETVIPGGGAAAPGSTLPKMTTKKTITDSKASQPNTEEISPQTKPKDIQAHPETVSASPSVHADLPRSCSVSDFSPQLRGFIGYQRIITPVPVPHNTTVRFHCEPVGEAPGEPFVGTCSDGTWTTPNNPSRVEISSRCREPMDYEPVIRITNESRIRTRYEVGPLGSVYVPLESKIHLECGPRRGATGVPVTWTVRRHRNGAVMVFNHTESSISFDVDLGDRYEVECRIPEELKKTLHIMELDLRFCNEPMLASEVVVLKRKSLRLEFGCKEGFVLHGHRAISCTTDGTWNQEPPVCIEPSRGAQK